MSDSFDHFDRNQFVKSTGHVTVILLQDFNFSAQSLAADHVDGVFVLVLTYCRGRNVASEILSRECGKTAPAASYFHNVIPWSQF